jgi:hypothetical protein
MSSDLGFHPGRRRFVTTVATAAAALTLPPTAFARARRRRQIPKRNIRRRSWISAALIHRGYGDANIQAVLGGNFRRLLGSTWTGAENKTGDKS